MYNSKADFRRVKNQIFAICLGNIGTFTFGHTYGWLSPSLVTLKSEERTPLVDGPATVDQIAWLAAAFGLGCIVGQGYGSLIGKKWGLKSGIGATSFPCLLNWLMIVFGNHIAYLHASRFFSGLTGGAQYYLVSNFVAEISDPIIRGRMGTLMLGSQCLGIFMIFVIGSYVDYYIVPYIFLPFPIIFFIIFLFIPHTPQFLILNNEMKKAEESIKFYKNLYDDTPETHEKIKEEVENVRTFINERLTTEKLKLSDFTTKEALQGALKSVFILFAYVGSGNLIFFSFAATIFRESGSDYDPKISSIVIALVQIFGVCLATTLIDKIGRRALMIIATFGCTIGLITMGIFNYLSVKGYDVNVVNWIPVTSTAITLISGSSGILPVTFVLLAEIFPAKIRKATSLAFLILLFVVLSITTSTYPVLANLYGLYTCFWLLAVLSSSGILFSVFMLQDTTGKNIN